MKSRKVILEARSVYCRVTVNLFIITQITTIYDQYYSISINFMRTKKKRLGGSEHRSMAHQLSHLGCPTKVQAGFSRFESRITISAVQNMKVRKKLQKNKAKVKSTKHLFTLFKLMLMTKLNLYRPVCKLCTKSSSKENLLQADSAPSYMRELKSPYADATKGNDGKEREYLR